MPAAHNPMSHTPTIMLQSRKPYGHVDVARSSYIVHNPVTSLPYGPSTLPFTQTLTGHGTGVGARVGTGVGASVNVVVCDVVCVVVGVVNAHVVNVPSVYAFITSVKTAAVALQLASVPSPPSIKKPPARQVKSGMCVSRVNAASAAFSTIAVSSQSVKRSSPPVGGAGGIKSACAGDTLGDAKHSTRPGLLVMLTALPQASKTLFKIAATRLHTSSDGTTNSWSGSTLAHASAPKYGVVVTVVVMVVVGVDVTVLVRLVVGVVVFVSVAVVLGVVNTQSWKVSSPPASA